MHTGTRGSPCMRHIVQVQLVGRHTTRFCPRSRQVHGRGTRPSRTLGWIWQIMGLSFIHPGAEMCSEMRRRTNDIRLHLGIAALFVRLLWCPPCQPVHHLQTCLPHPATVPEQTPSSAS